jgi:hypothetical protein
MFDDFDTEETNEAMELSELASDLEWDACWAEFDSVLASG